MVLSEQSMLLSEQTMLLSEHIMVLSHENFDGKSKVSKIEKQEELVGCPSESLKMTSELIF